MLSLRQNIMVAGKTGQKEKKWYGATVLDLYDSEALISMPRIKGQVMVPEENETLEISFVNGETRYLYETTVCQVFGQEALVIAQPVQVDRIDFRQYPRARADLEVLFAETRPGDADPEYKRGYLVDISGNGMRLAADQLCSPGTKFSIKLNLPAGDGIMPVEVEGLVVRVVVDDRKDPAEYQLGLKYTRVDKKHRDMIVQYVNQRLNRT
ncbi:MAG: flagellar brake protein [Peptococcaceae bacterium]|nr:flagellar brake protein [Peptococcaceae bacterium]